MKALTHGIQPTLIRIFDQEEQELFNYYCDYFCDDTSLKTSDEINHHENQKTWSYPAAYESLDLEQYFMSLCKTDIERERVKLELSLFKERDLERLLRWSIYFMDVVREKKLFIGVGRGSSVSSYCLYLIKLHLVDSIKFNLNIHDFLK